jgi:hypothetical protein
LTLFAQVTRSPAIDQLLDRHFDGQPDAATLALV